MTGYTVVVPKKVEKAITRIPLPWRERILRTIRALRSNPFLGEPLRGELKGKRKMRVWPYRIIYFIDKSNRTVVIAEAGHRGGMSYR